MAATKKQSNRRGTAKTTSGRKNTRKKQTRKQVKKQGVTSGFQTEIILLTILAASIILIISNLGMGGVVGAAISKASFGIMGLLAYVFPVLIFVGAAFLVSNSKNPLAYKKALAALVFFVFLCGLVQLLTEGYMSSTTMSEYYSTCSTYRTGGGVLGGAICISTTSAFGVAGGYVIIILVLLISLILITQKSFFGFVFCIWDAVCALARDGHDMYMEGQPERDLRKELRVQERRQRREERQAQRVRELEEALVQENNDGEETAAKEKKSTGFLEGTLLVPSEAKKKKNRKTVLRDHKKTAEGIKNDTATDTDSVAVVSDMTSDFAGNAGNRTGKGNDTDKSLAQEAAEEVDEAPLTTDADGRFHIDAKTTLSNLIKQSPEVVDYLISLNPKFEKLKTPMVLHADGEYCGDVTEMHFKCLPRKLHVLW